MKFNSYHEYRDWYMSRDSKLTEKEIREKYFKNEDNFINDSNFDGICPKEILKKHLKNKKTVLKLLDSKQIDERKIQTIFCNMSDELKKDKDILTAFIRIALKQNILLDFDTQIKNSLINNSTFDFTGYIEYISKNNPKLLKSEEFQDSAKAFLLNCFKLEAEKKEKLKQQEKEQKKIAKQQKLEQQEKEKRKIEKQQLIVENRQKKENERQATELAREVQIEFYKSTVSDRLVDKYLDISGRYSEAAQLRKDAKEGKLPKSTKKYMIDYLKEHDSNFSLYYFVFRELPTDYSGIKDDVLAPIIEAVNDIFDVPEKMNLNKKIQFIKKFRYEKGVKLDECPNEFYLDSQFVDQLCVAAREKLKEYGANLNAKYCIVRGLKDINNLDGLVDKEVTEKIKVEMAEFEKKIEERILEATRSVSDDINLNIHSAFDGFGG